MKNEIDHLLESEMKSEDHIDQMIYDDTDGEMIDAVMDNNVESIFSNPEESEDEDDE